MAAPGSRIIENTPTERTRCCIVGGGPAGVILALLLARRGVPTSLGAGRRRL